MLKFGFTDLQHILIILARGLKYFYDIELLYPLDEFQTNWIFFRGNIKHKHLFYRVGDTIKVMFLFHVSSIKDPICLKLVKCFCYCSASTKTSFGFCSRSKLLRLKFGNNNKKLQGNANYSALKAVIGMTKVANEIYLPYLQLCGKAFLRISCIVVVKVAQSYVKITKMEAFLRTQPKYFLQNIL